VAAAARLPAAAGAAVPAAADRRRRRGRRTAGTERGDAAEHRGAGGPEREPRSGLQQRAARAGNRAAGYLPRHAAGWIPAAATTAAAAAAGADQYGNPDVAVRRSRGPGNDRRPA